MALVAPAPLGFERSPIPGSTPEDVNMEALQVYLRARAPALLEQMSEEQLAGRIGLLSTSAGKLRPTVAGLLMFGIMPQVFRPEWGVSVVRVNGRVLSDAIESREDLEGTVPQLVEAVLASVERNTRSVPDDLAPDETASEYPQVAVREAVVNALVHRDLRLPGRVMIRLFDDRLEVWSPGGMPTALSLEDQAQHGGVSLPRNPVLSQVARSLGLMEQIGRGLTTIRRTVHEKSGRHIHILSSQAETRVIMPSALYMAQPRADH